MAGESRHRRLYERRANLLARSAALRVRMRHDTEALSAPLAVADQTLEAARWLRAHPEWPLGALALWAMVRPRRAMIWLTRGWWLWRASRRWL